MYTNTATRERPTHEQKHNKLALYQVPALVSAAAGGQRKKSGNASSRAQIAHRALETRLSAPSRGIRVLEGLPMPGVNVDGGERPLGEIAAGVLPPAMELHSNKRNVTC
jgi:hypothetical protein